MSLPFVPREGKSEIRHDFFRPFCILSLWELMEKFEAGQIYSAALRLSHVLRPYEAKTATNTEAIKQKSYIESKERIDFLCRELKRINFKHALVTAQELRKVIYEQVTERQVPESGTWILFSPEAAYNYRANVRDLVTNLERELSNRIIMFLPDRMVDYYNGSIVRLSDAVLAKFGSLQHDMNEAGKCFAFGEYTACVFHLMRVLEIVLRKFAGKLGVSRQIFEKKDWGIILNQINKKLKDDPNDSVRG